jgi:hypothetical protein
MPIEFTVRTDDLKRAARLLAANRNEFKDSDIAILTASAATLELKAVGTETTIVADGTQPGAARLPLSVLLRVVEIAGDYKRKETSVLIENGYTKVGRTMTRNSDIVIGGVHEQAFSIPTDASVLDTLALASLLSDQQIADAGLLTRIESAHRRVSSAINSALGALQGFNITGAEIAEMIEKKVIEAAQVIREVANQ